MQMKELQEIKSNKEDFLSLLPILVASKCGFPLQLGNFHSLPSTNLNQSPKLKRILRIFNKGSINLLPGAIIQSLWLEYVSSPERRDVP